MDTALAFAMGEAYRGREMKVFDWDKAARIIRDSHAQFAVAGLKEDMEWTSGEIVENFEPVKSGQFCMYLASTWATPVLCIDDEVIDCFVMEHETKWNANTVWPESALQIFKKTEEATK